jgi:predicted Zn finger-like uncharacterized protein
MKITCQSCQSKYNVADEKVQGKIVKIRCRKCGATIVVNGSEGAATNGGAPAESVANGASGGGEGQWHVNVSETDQRTVSLAELVDLYNAGAVNQETFIWTDGMDDWKPLAEVEAVVSALNAGTASPPVATDPPRAAASFVPAAASSGPSFAASPGVQAASATASVEPKRAAVKREGGRSRDLFGTTDDIQTSASASPSKGAAAQAAGLSPAVDDSKLTGERNESSVLFSLAVLTKSADAAPASQPAKNNKEDSGLIDLKALAAKAESMRPPAAAAAAPAADVFSAPLGAAPMPLGAPLGAVHSSGDEGQAKSKLPMIIGAGIGAVVVLVLGVVIGVKVFAAPAALPAPSATASAMASTDTAASAAAAAAPSATASAAPAPSASATAVASKTTGHGGGGGHYSGAKVPGTGGGGGTAGAATGATGGTGGQTPPPQLKKPTNDCGCAGDLMCLMKCSTAH